MRGMPKHASELADAVTYRDAASLLGISVRTICRLVERGHIRPFYLPGSARPRIPLDQVVSIRKQTDRSKVPHPETALDRERRSRGPRPRGGRGST